MFSEQVNVYVNKHVLPTHESLSYRPFIFKLSPITEAGVIDRLRETYLVGAQEVLKTAKSEPHTIGE
jgi:hypothetical protein